MPVTGSDIPEPEWWAHARELERMGVSRYQIAKSIKTSYSAVRYALDPEYRARTKKLSREWQKAHPERQGSHQDSRRTELRRKVRAYWRESGRERGLHELYREAGCL